MEGYSSISSKWGEINTSYSGKKTIAIKDALGGIAYSITYVTKAEDRDLTKIWTSVGDAKKEQIFFLKDEMDLLPQEKQDELLNAFMQGLQTSEELKFSTADLKKEFPEELSDKIEVLFTKKLPELVAASLLAKGKSVKLVLDAGEGTAESRYFRSKFKITTEKIIHKESLGEGSFKTMSKVTELLFSKTGQLLKKDVHVKGKFKVDFWSAGTRKLQQKICLNECNLLSSLKEKKVPHLIEYHGVKQKGKQKTGILLHYYSEGDATRLVEKTHTDKTSLDPNVYNPKLKCFLNAAEAVAVLHKLKVCHADIKPDNIFLDKTSEGEVEGVLADLGGAGTTGSKIICSAEIFLDVETRRKRFSFFKRVTEKNDVWALGLTLLELAKGKGSNEFTFQDQFSYKTWYAEYEKILSTLDLTHPIDQLIAMCLQPATHRPTAAEIVQRASDILKTNTSLPNFDIKKYPPPFPSLFGRIGLAIQNLWNKLFGSPKSKIK